MIPVFSIIIPAYNVELYIEKTISSILEQNNSNIEIIIVNDGSKDKTEQVVKRIAESSCIQNIFLYTKENNGVSSARNYGLEKAKGKYVYFLDGDDYISSGFVDALIGLIKKYDSQIIHWPYDLVNEAGNVISSFPYSKEPVLEKTGLAVLNSILLEKSTRIWTGSAAYNKSFLNQNDVQYTNGCRVGEDLELIFKSLAYADSVLFTDQLKTYYLQRPASVMSRYSLTKFDAVYALQRTRDLFLTFDTPEYLLLAKHTDEYEILHFYTGTYRKCLQYLVEHDKMQASHAMKQLNKEIDARYPDLGKEVTEKINSRKRKLIPDKLDIFRLSPILYLYLSKFSDKKAVDEIQ